MSKSGDDAGYMRRAMEEAERARGHTGDNPWVGCVLVDGEGVVVAAGHTRGPGEDHAEIGALRVARRLGVPLADLTLYSTLEPCSFHGRTPSCARVIVEARPLRVVTGMRDPHPRVDGAGVQLLRDAGLDVTEGICEAEVRRQLGAWVLGHHPHEPLRRALALVQERGLKGDGLRQALAEVYAVPPEQVDPVLATLRTTLPGERL